MKGQKHKIQKGDIGYMVCQTRKEIILTVLYYSISLAIFAIGYISTGTKSNLLTVVAVLGLLPSSKSLVRMIMFLKAPKFNQEQAEMLQREVAPLDTVFDLVLTSYETTFPINCFVVRNNNLCAYSAFDKCDEERFTEHVQKMLVQNGFSNITVKLMKDQNKFITRAKQLKELEYIGKEQDILALMCDISL